MLILKCFRVLLFISAALVTTGCTTIDHTPTAGPPSGPNPPSISATEWTNLSTEQQIHARVAELWGRMSSHLGQRGYRLGLGADGTFKAAITKASSEIQAMPPGDQRAKTEEVVANINYVIETMIRESYKIPGYQEHHYRTVGEETLMNALKKLCPIWPFCK